MGREAEAVAVETFEEPAQAVGLASVGKAVVPTLVRKNDSAALKLARLSLPTFGLRHPVGHRRTRGPQASAVRANY